MPCYEFSCSVDGVFEELLPISRSSDPHHKCPKCGSQAERVFSRVTMRSDPYWSGVMTEYGYQTSLTKVEQIRKEKHHVVIGDRRDAEGIAKVAERGRKSAQERVDKQLSEATRKLFGPSGLAIGDTGKIPEQLKLRESADDL